MRQRGCSKLPFTYSRYGNAFFALTGAGGKNPFAYRCSELTLRGAASGGGLFQPASENELREPEPGGPCSAVTPPLHHLSEHAPFESYHLGRGVAPVRSSP